ncbi:MAG: bifunctional folylpolyglutamate synthase/dihydrofolate synthase [Cyanobacteria bacterium SIG28]|nr:bifunctional folylpolyglutamate synthase/dihydrofolate synthase [Cyanobacteria bacterium SIG28]
MNYLETLKQLTSSKTFQINLGLERIQEVLQKLGNPQKDLQYIHVAGTNGKGSTCAILNSILTEAGYKTGLYTSPHIFDYTERIKINGIDISQEDFAQLFEEINSIGVELTEFEFLTAMMFLYFQRNNVEIVVLETGLGGRFDATNVIEKNLCSIITHIDLDHTERLGKTKDDIAFEKAGIIKPNCPIITSMGYEAIRDRADELNSMFIMTSPYVQQEFVEALALKGLHQIENLSLAITAINYLFKNIDENTIKNALGKVKNPYRFEYIKDKNLIIDVSHNPNGIEALRNNLDFYYPCQKRRFVFGCLKNKDYEKMMQILFKEEDEILLNEFDYPNSCSYEELSKKCPYKTEKYVNQNLSVDKLNIICGSFYMLKGLKNLF